MRAYQRCIDLDGQRVDCIVLRARQLLGISQRMGPNGRTTIDAIRGVGPDGIGGGAGGDDGGDEEEEERVEEVGSGGWGSFFKPKAKAKPKPKPKPTSKAKTETRSEAELLLAAADAKPADETKKLHEESVALDPAITDREIALAMERVSVAWEIANKVSVGSVVVVTLVILFVIHLVIRLLIRFVIRSVICLVFRRVIVEGYYSTQRATNSWYSLLPLTTHPPSQPATHPPTHPPTIYHLS